jgi:hypothetical protein
MRAGERDMAHARGEAVASYRRFLADEDDIDVQESAPMPLLEFVPVTSPATASAEIVPVAATSIRNERPEIEWAPAAALRTTREVPLDEHRDDGAAPRRPRRAGVLAALALAAAVVLGGTAIGSIERDAADEVTVTVQNPSERHGTDSLPVCEDVHVAGVIAADGAATVDYQWMVDGRPIAAPQSHTFTGADQITIDSPTYVGVNATEQDQDGAVTRSYELVVSRHDREGWHEKGIAKVRCALNGGIDAATSAVTVRVQEVGKVDPDNSPSCNDVHVTGVIRATRAVTVNYQWLINRAPAAPPQPLTFPGPGEVAVDSPSSLPDNTKRVHDEQPGLIYELVVTRPDGETSSESAYEVQCTVT